MRQKYRRHWIKLAKRKSTQSNTVSQSPKATTAQSLSTPPSLSTASTKTDNSVTLRLVCGHKLVVASRPNPRKKWPDPQMCETCKKKQRVGEIHGPKVSATNITAPTAPKDYVKKLKKAMGVK